METDKQLYNEFQPLWSDLVDSEDFPTSRPLLAHYTSLANLERILETEELWFSNPLVMNDIEEVRFGLLYGSELFRNSEAIHRACGTNERVNILRNSYDQLFRMFDTQHVFDTYVFCLSVHDHDDYDGLLSMWRGYGGNGHGAALVFDTKKINVLEESPLIIARVHYSSSEERKNWLVMLMDRFAELLASVDIPNDKLHIPAFSLFERLKMFSLFTKHSGFSEEREWRVVYSPDRDKNKILEPMFHYSIGPRGAEPRLRFKIAPIEGLTKSDLSLDNLVERIILGPSISTPMARMAILRMLDRLGKGSIKDRVVPSSIPFRPIRYF